MRGALFFAKADPVSNDACKMRRASEMRSGDELRKIIMDGG